MHLDKGTYHTALAEFLYNLVLAIVHQSYH